MVFLVLERLVVGFGIIGVIAGQSQQKYAEKLCSIERRLIVCDFIFLYITLREVGLLALDLVAFIWSAHISPFVTHPGAVYHLPTVLWPL